jgi:hypothetical protein
MVPVLIVGTPRAASAAVVAVGPTVTASLLEDSPFPGQDASCSVTGYTQLHDTALYSVRATIKCRWSWGNAGIDGGRLVARDGNTSSTNDCRFEAARFAVVEDTAAETTLTANLHPSTPPQADCVLSHGDMWLLSSCSGGSGGCDGNDSVRVSWEGFGWGLGALPTAAPGGMADWSCQWATGKAPKWGAEYQSSVGGYAHIRRDLTRNITMKSPLVGVGGATSGETWRWDYYVVVRSNARTGLAQEEPVYPSGGWTHLDTADAGGSGGWTYNYVKDGRRYYVNPMSGGTFSVGSAAGVNYSATATTGFSRYAERNLVPVPSAFEIVGVGIKLVRTSATAVYSTHRPVSPSTSLNVPGVGDNSYSRCAMYWGEQIAFGTFSGDTSGVPLGPLNFDGTPNPVAEPGTLDPGTPSPSDDVGCDGFSFTDPSSWAGAGVCVMVKALKAIWTTLGGIASTLASIPGQIMSALGGLLTDLFVPDGDLLEANFQEVQDAYADTAPGAWVEAVGDFDVPANAATGCAGPHVEVPLGDGIVMEADPLNACTGSAAELAALCKLIITVTIGFFGGLACIRAVGSGFNWNPGGSAG